MKEPTEVSRFTYFKLLTRHYYQEKRLLRWCVDALVVFFFFAVIAVIHALPSHISIARSLLEGSE